MRSVKLELQAEPAAQGFVITGRSGPSIGLSDSTATSAA